MNVNDKISDEPQLMVHERHRQVEARISKKRGTRLSNSTLDDDHGQIVVNAPAIVSKQTCVARPTCPRGN